MKKLLIKFANWILRECIPSVFSFDDELYINGHTYELKEVTRTFEPDGSGELTVVVRER